MVLFQLKVLLSLCSRTQAVICHNYRICHSHIVVEVLAMTLMGKLTFHYSLIDLSGVGLLSVLTRFVLNRFSK